MIPTSASPDSIRAKSGSWSDRRGPGPGSDFPFRSREGSLSAAWDMGLSSIDSATDTARGTFGSGARSPIPGNILRQPLGERGLRRITQLGAGPGDVGVG